MAVKTVSTTPIEGQQPGYPENFMQSVFNAIGGVAGKTLTLGGDGRYLDSEAIQTILKMAAANGAARVLVGRDVRT